MIGSWFPGSLRDAVAERGAGDEMAPLLLRPAAAPGAGAEPWRFEWRVGDMQPLAAVVKSQPAVQPFTDRVFTDAALQRD